MIQPLEESDLGRVSCSDEALTSPPVMETFEPTALALLLTSNSSRRQVRSTSLPVKFLTFVIGLLKSDAKILEEECWL